MGPGRSSSGTKDGGAHKGAEDRRRRGRSRGGCRDVADWGRSEGLRGPPKSFLSDAIGRTVNACEVDSMVWGGVGHGAVNQLWIGATTDTFAMRYGWILLA